MIELKQFLDDVEARIYPAQEEDVAAQWLDFCALKCGSEFFSPHRSPAPSNVEWPRVLINDAFNDVELMVYHQLKGVSDMLAQGSGLMLSVRANYGTGIIPSMFGGKMFYLDDSADTLPSTMPLENKLDGLHAVVDRHEIDYSRGLAPRVFDFARRWHEVIVDYPRISRYVYLYNPDLQGPFPLVDMLMGSELYYALYDEPEFIHEALAFMTDVYLDFTAKWQALCPTFDDKHSVEWGLLHPGLTMLRNDAIVNLSDKMYREFAMPYDARVFGKLGGTMHFCGRGDHYIASACSIDGFSGINMSQPELNDMEKIYAATIENGMLIIGLPEHEIVRASAASRHLLGRVHSGAALSAYRESK